MSFANNRRWQSRPTKYYGVTDQYLRDHGLRRKSIAKDGCCLFRAVAEQVYLTQTAHWDLRRMCASYIKENPSRFKSFITISLSDYCWQLSNCNLWGGEVEIVALSELLEQPIVVYREHNGKVVYNRFKVKNSDKPEILLLFTGNNHYDSLWQSDEEHISSICQSILYELLIETVMETKMNQQDLKDAIKLRGADFNNQRFQQGGRNHFPVLERYPDDILRGLSTISYFNVAYRVWKREKEANERADRRLAVTMQFTIGDQCSITVDGKQYNGSIVSGLTNSNMVEVFVADPLHKRVKVPINEIRLMKQQQGQTKTRGRHYQKSSGASSVKVEGVTGGKSEVTPTSSNTANTPRKSYSKNGKAQSRQDHRQQRSHTFDKKETLAVTSKQEGNQDPTHTPPNSKEDASDPIKQDDPSPPSDKLKEASFDHECQQQGQPHPSVGGFSDTTVRMNSLMGRGNPLEIFNHVSLASYNEAPESEWPILHAGCVSGRGHMGNMVTAMSNPQRCHLDGPPPPPVGMDPPPQLPFPVYSHDPMHFLIQELNPPLHLLKTGTAEGRQQFMYEFAQNSLRFYSKYVSDPELEDALNELLCMEFEEFVTAPSQYNQGEFSVVTSLTSREGSQLDIRDPSPSDNSDDHTPRVSEEDRTSSDTHTESPVEQIPHKDDLVTSSSESATVQIPPPATAAEGEGSFDKEGEERIPHVSPVPPPNNASNGGTQPESPVNMTPFQPPLMFPPGAHPPYGYPYPVMFPGPMFPWPYYPHMGGAFMVPPHMVPPQMRGMPMVSSPTNEEVTGNDEPSEREQQKQTVDVTVADQDEVEDTPTPKQEDKTANEDVSKPSTEDETVPAVEKEEIEQDQKSKQENTKDEGDLKNKDGKNSRTRSFTRGGNQSNRRNFYHRGYYRNNIKYQQNSGGAKHQYQDQKRKGNHTNNTSNTSTNGSKEQNQQL